MKGNKFMKNISKVLLSGCMIFAFLCTPVTNLFSKITKVFANTSSELTDVEGANVKVEGFVDNGLVGSAVRLPVVKIGDTTYKADGTKAGASDIDLVYDIKTPAGKGTIAKADIQSDNDGYYFIPTTEGVYTLDVHTVKDGKLSTVVKGLHINVTKPEADFSIMTNAIVKDGEKANILPATISIADLASVDFKLDAPETDGDITKIKVTCIPAGSTGASDNYTMELISDPGYFHFVEADRTALAEKAKVGSYTFRYEYIENGVTLQELTSTCKVVADDSFEDDITLAFGSLTSGSELSSSEIGKWVTLPSVTVYNSKSGSTDSVPAVVSIKVTPSSSISDAKVEQDGYTFKANKIGKYQVTYTATYPYTDITVKKNFTIELKDETAPEVMLVDTYTRATDAVEEDFVESLTDATDTIKSVYVLSGGEAKIAIPAIYAKDNSSDGNYTMSRDVVFNNVTTEITADNNTATTHKVTEEGVYTINYRVTDSSNKTSVKKQIVVVLSEASILGFKDGATSLDDVTKPVITTGTAPRMVENTGTLVVAMPTATDSITSNIRAKFSKLNNNSYSSWFSNVDITTTIQGYTSAGAVVSTAKYKLTEDDINDDGKYEIDMTEHSELTNDSVAYFKLLYSAKADWMGDSVTAATDASSKINYVNVSEDLTSATIAIAGTDLFSVLAEKNEATINAVVGNSSWTILSNGMIEVDTDKYVAPFNQYSTENPNAVVLPDLIITDSEDGSNLSVTGTITDSLGNTKTFVPEITKIEAVTNAYEYYVTLGSHELATAGMYTITVNAVDKGGNISTYSFAIMVNDTTGPSDVVLDVDIVGDSTISKTFYTGEFISFPEATVEDNTDGECTYVAKLTSYPNGANITENQYNRGFRTLTAGDYTITYYCEDSSGNPFEKSYTLTVTAKDYTEIVVNEDFFEANGGNVYKSGYYYEFDDEKTTNKIVIPFGSTRNTVDSSKNNLEIKPTVKKGDVTQTVTAEGDNYTFNATQGTYTVEYKSGTVSKTYTLYIGDTEAPTIKWLEDIPTTIKVGESWGKGIKDMFTITDVNNGEVTTLEAERIEIVDPDNAATLLNGENQVTFSKEGTYTLKVVFSDGVNDVTETKTITVSTTEGTTTNNTTNVVGTILLIASILVVGGVILYLILSSKKGGKKKN